MRDDGDCIDADLRPFANDGEVKYPCACGQEDLVFDSAAEERGVGACRPSALVGQNELIA